MNLEHSKFKQKVSSPLICRICGDIARGLNFSVISCMSCKMFFRRHAQSSLFKQQCRFDHKCSITRKTRKCCLPCRLQRCFQAGMDVKLIRHSHERKRTIQLSKPRSLSLLDKDRSTLTLDEWNLLSNITNAYDEQNLLIQTEDFFKQQFSLPPKIRSKDSNTLNYIGSLFSSIHVFIRRCPLFQSLSVSFRQALIKRNLNAVGGFNAFFLATQMNVFENEIYSKFIDNIYGYGYSKSVIQASRRLQQNGTLIKIMLMLMSFSSNCALVEINYTENIQIIFNPKILIEIQDLIVTMLWKYLIYQYGFNEAIIRFLSLIQSILDMIQRMADGLNVQKHWTMVGNIVDQTIRSLSLENSSS
ncbi:unnamed protein product [Rotaria sp. Silwood2]|nr:unnamed protein product [Rotaria sp. Silwood2]CAF2957596.1 unnamed protein product [Rotaria sp. Silwood2]CAF3925723.1 unnamed protein product [Rotaria sp. Silwood2]CAF3991027.1 unnamed protein product [Rotaria sp. Silwood2]CAF4052522.1 unnamed protein product [Rotaria sp. Silwood2]